MSFDINPLGNTFYLQQLEREVAQMKAIRQVAGHEETKAAARPTRLKSWFSLAIRSLWTWATA